MSFKQKQGVQPTKKKQMDKIINLTTKNGIKIKKIQQRKPKGYKIYKEK